MEAAPPCPSPEITFLIFAGKGGVGKTTLACATAVRLAREFPGKEILLFSTDPAHSLAACLEADLGPQPVRLGPGLSAMEIDAPGEFAALKQQYQQELEKFLHTAFENFDIPFDRRVMERMLDLSPPGLDEIMALVRAMEFLEAGRYDIFILDSAPTGHLLRLLELPELIDQWLKTFFGLLLKYKLTFRFPSSLSAVGKNFPEPEASEKPVAGPGPGRALRRDHPDGNGLPGDQRPAGGLRAAGSAGAGAVSQPGHPGRGLSPVRRPEPPGGAH